MNNKISLNYWNNYFKKNKNKTIMVDDWLDNFQDIIENCLTYIIDLGCGFGNNSLYLTKKGKKVIACDFSKDAINYVKNNIPSVTTKCFDMVNGLPFIDNSCELIIADLSLHYFKHEDTVKIINEIKRILKDNGHLIFRVNSINDINYGVGNGELIESNLYKKDNRLKRFFDKKNILKYFSEFKIEYLKEENMTRYDMLKVVYVGCVRK